MDSALGWLGDVFRAVLLIVPRVVIVRATHAGVKFVWGHNVKLLMPGVHLWWPLVTEIEVIEVRPKPLGMPQQYIETADGVSVGAASVVTYEVLDVMAALTESADYEEAVAECGSAVVAEILASENYDALMNDRRRINTRLQEAMNDALGKYGLRVLTAQLSDFARSRMIALWGATNG